MKKVRNIVIMLLMAALLVSALAGCGGSKDTPSGGGSKEETEKQLTAEEIMDNMKTAMEGANSLKGDMNMTMDFEVEFMNYEMGMFMGMDATVESVKPDQSHTKVAMNLKMTGFQEGEQNQEVEMYVDGDTAYVSQNGGSWQKGSLSQVTGGKIDLTSTPTNLSEYGLDVVLNGKNTVNGKECYVLTSEIKGETFAKMYESIGAGNESFQQILDATEAAGTLDELSIPFTMYVGVDDMLAYKYEFEMKTFFEVAYVAMMKQEPSLKDVDVEINVKECDMVVNLYDYNSLDKIEIPDSVR
ncbi:MAG: hypothetical protein IJL97_06020 [Lachnospiraceae bacterium]|nr:hypothetical protein [Lachnospiraceae bacterium]